MDVRPGHGRTAVQLPAFFGFRFCARNFFGGTIRKLGGAGTIRILKAGDLARVHSRESN